MDRKLAKRIGARVKTARERMGLSQEAFAPLAGLTRGYLSEIETGRKLPSLETLPGICQATGITPNRMLAA